MPTTPNKTVVPSHVPDVTEQPLNSLRNTHAPTLTRIVGTNKPPIPVAAFQACL